MPNWSIAWTSTHTENAHYHWEEIHYTNSRFGVIWLWRLWHIHDMRGWPARSESKRVQIVNIERIKTSRLAFWRHWPIEWYESFRITKARVFFNPRRWWRWKLRQSGSIWISHTSRWPQNKTFESCNYTSNARDTFWQPKSYLNHETRQAKNILPTQIVKITWRLKINRAENESATTGDRQVEIKMRFLERKIWEIDPRTKVLASQKKRSLDRERQLKIVNWKIAK